MIYLSYYIEFCGLYLSDALSDSYNEVIIAHPFIDLKNTLLMIGNVTNLILMMEINANYYIPVCEGL